GTAPGNGQNKDARRHEGPSGIVEGQDRMAMNKQEFLDLCGAYALGALDGEDLLLFREAMAHADADMKAALAEALRAAEHLSLAAPEAVPSPAVKDRLMKSIRAQAASAPEPRR